MGKKSRLKRERRSQKPGPVIAQMPNPFAGIPMEQRLKFLIEAAPEHEQKFSESMIRIGAFLSKVDPLCAIATLTLHSTAATVRDDGSVEQMQATGLSQSHAELVQALALRVPEDRQSDTPAFSQEVQQLIDAALEVSKHFKWKRRSEIAKCQTAQEQAEFVVREHIRNTTEMGRQWGYYGHVQILISDLVAPLEAVMRASVGFGPTELLKVFTALMTRVEKAIHEFWAGLRTTFEAKAPAALVRAYFRAFPEFKGDPEQFLSLVRDQNLGLEETKVMLMNHAEFYLACKFIFTATALADESGISTEVVEKILKLHALNFGDLANFNPEHLLLNNPIWTKPVIRLGDGTYFCALPQLMAAFALDTMDALAKGHPALVQEINDRRPVFLEKRVEQAVAAAFPMATLHTGVKWRNASGDTEYENDLVVQQDSFLVIIESKSGRVPPEARRGARKSLKESIDKLLVEPSRQSWGLEQAIWKAQANDPEFVHLRRVLPFDLDAVKRIVRLTVTLEDFGMLQCSLNGLRDAGYVPRDLVVAPAMTIADLEIVFDILESVPEKLHYLLRRTALEGHLVTASDELDLLGVYLSTSLDLGEMESGDAPVMMPEMSKHINDYYIARENGLTAKKPELPLTPRWRAMISGLEARKSSRWLEAAVMLLEVSPLDQIKIEDRLETLIKNVRRDRENAGDRNALVLTPANARSNTVAFVALTREQVPDRFRFIENVSKGCLAKDGIRSCVVVALDVDDDRPYRTIAAYVDAKKSPGQPLESQ